MTNTLMINTWHTCDGHATSVTAGKDQQCATVVQLVEHYISRERRFESHLWHLYGADKAGGADGRVPALQEYYCFEVGSSPTGSTTQLSYIIPEWMMR